MTVAAVLIDFTHSSVGRIPAGTSRVAGYVTGTPDILWTSADWARFSGAKVRIDQSAGGKLFAGGSADVIDVESGAATVADAVAGVVERQKAGAYSTIYISAGNLAGLKTALADAKVVMNRVGFWVANWNLNQAEATAQLGNEIVAIQWASPSSNPNTILPGTSLTLTEANADLSVCLTGWFPPPPPPVPWQQVALQDVQSIQAALGQVQSLLAAHQ